MEGRKAMPHMWNEVITPMEDANSMLIAYEYIMCRQEEAANGTRNYLLTPIKFDELVRGSTLSMEDSSSSQLQEIREKREFMDEFSNSQRQRYSEHRCKIQRN